MSQLRRVGKIMRNNSVNFEKMRHMMLAEEFWRGILTTVLLAMISTYVSLYMLVVLRGSCWNAVERVESVPNQKIRFSSWLWYKVYVIVVRGQKIILRVRMFFTP